MSAMNVKISDLMTTQVMTTTRHRTLGHVRKQMDTHGVHALPVIDTDGEPLGMITSSDLLDGRGDGSRVGTIMSHDVVTVPAYSEPRLAARIMRNKRIHHLVVTHEKKIVGILSTFDLLRLVEDHSFRAKQAPKSRRSTKPVEPENGA